MGELGHTAAGLGVSSCKRVIPAMRALSLVLVGESNSSWPHASQGLRWPRPGQLEEGRPPSSPETARHPHRSCATRHSVPGSAVSRRSRTRCRRRRPSWRPTGGRPASRPHDPCRRAALCTRRGAGDLQGHPRSSSRGLGSGHQVRGAGPAAGQSAGRVPHHHGGGARRQRAGIHRGCPEGTGAAGGCHLSVQDH